MPIIPDYNPNTGGNVQPVAPSLGAAMAPGRALQQVGEGIQQAAGSALDIAAVRQAAHDTAALNSARLAMQEATSGNAEFRAKSPHDDAKGEADLEKRVAAARTNVLADKTLSPKMRQRIDTEFTGWQGKALSDVRVDSLNKRTARDRTVTTQTVEAYRRSGNHEEARLVVREAVDAGIYHADEATVDLKFLDQDETETVKKKEAEKYELGAIDDPITTLEVLTAKGENGYLNNPGMDESTRARLIRGAERNLAQERDREFGEMKELIDANKITPTELEDAPQFLRDSEKRALAAHQKRLTPPTDEEDRAAWNEVIKVRSAYNAAKDRTLGEVEYRDMHRDSRAKILSLMPSGYNGPLLETLQRFSPARIYDMEAPKPPTRDDVNKDVGLEIRSTTAAAYDSGFFGKVGEEATPQEKELAARGRRDMERKAVDWVLSQKDMTPEAARTYTDSLLSGVRVKSAVNDLRQFVPGGGQRMRPAPALPPLPAKIGVDLRTSDPLQIPPGSGDASDALLPAKQLDTFLDQ